MDQNEPLINVFAPPEDDSIENRPLASSPSGPVSYDQALAQVAAAGAELDWSDVIPLQFWPALTSLLEHAGLGPKEYLAAYLSFMPIGFAARRLLPLAEELDRALVLHRWTSCGQEASPVLVQLQVEKDPMGGFRPTGKRVVPTVHGVPTSDAFLLNGAALAAIARPRTAKSMVVVTDPLDFILWSIQEYSSQRRKDGGTVGGEWTSRYQARPVIGALSDVARDPAGLLRLVPKGCTVYLRAHQPRLGKTLANALVGHAQVRLLSSDGERTDMRRLHDGELLTSSDLGRHPVCGTRPYRGAVAGIREQTLGEAAVDAGHRWQQRADGERALMTTPWPKLDEALGGGLDSGCHVLVGGTGSWKTDVGACYVNSGAEEGRCCTAPCEAGSGH